jgi:hypothetical protein
LDNTSSRQPDWPALAAIKIQDQIPIYRMHEVGATLPSARRSIPSRSANRPNCACGALTLRMKKAFGPVNPPSSRPAARLDLREGIEQRAQA